MERIKVARLYLILQLACLLILSDSSWCRVGVVEDGEILSLVTHQGVTLSGKQGSSFYFE